MKTIDSIIFDLDGTLWDATAATASGWNKAIKVLGLKNPEISNVDIQGICGHPYRKCMEILLPGLVKGNFDELYQALNFHEEASIREHGGDLFEYVEDGIKNLAKKYKLFIVSNCQGWYLDNFFEKYPLNEFFTDWTCNGMSGKPKNEMILDIKARNKLNNPIYVGDTEGDQNSSQKAGVPFYYAAYGFGKCNEYDKQINSFKELCEIM